MHRADDSLPPAASPQLRKVMSIAQIRWLEDRGTQVLS